MLPGHDLAPLQLASQILFIHSRTSLPSFADNVAPPNLLPAAKAHFTSSSSFLRAERQRDTGCIVHCVLDCANAIDEASIPASTIAIVVTRG